MAKCASVTSISALSDAGVDPVTGKAEDPAHSPFLQPPHEEFASYEMARGIDGPMAGFSHPEMLSGVYRLFVKGDFEAAHDLFDRYLPLLDYEAQGFWGVAARKEVMRRRGAIRHA